MTTARAAGRQGVRVVARAGYLAKGLIYLTVGILSLLAALGFAEGRVTGTDSVIHILAGGAPGRVGFAVLAAGLAGHVFWRLYQAIADPARQGQGPLALVRRFGYGISALFYISLMMVAVSAMTGILDGGNESEDAAETVLSFTGGSLALGLLGLGVIGTGFYQLYRAWTQPFRNKWHGSPHRIGRLHSPRTVGAIAWTSSFGIGVRAVLFFMIGWYLVRAGWFSSSEEIIDVGAALWMIGTETFGRPLLAATSAGLFFYGLYCLFNAALRRIETRG